MFCEKYGTILRVKSEKKGGKKTNRLPMRSRLPSFTSKSRLLEPDRWRPTHHYYPTFYNMREKTFTILLHLNQSKVALAYLFVINPDARLGTFLSLRGKNALNLAITFALLQQMEWVLETNL